MLLSKVRILFLLFSIVAVSASEFQLKPEKEAETRIIGGTPTKDGKMFPYYVWIKAYDKNDNLKSCGANIINKQWIVTLKSCVSNASKIVVDFQHFYITYSDRNYIIEIKNPEIYHWPVGDYAISLLKLPILLIFNSETGSISLPYHSESSLFGEPLIMPSITTITNSATSNQLTYGIFKAASSEKCSSVYGTSFDSYWQICVEAWPNFNNYACKNDLGTGLILNWQKYPELSGIVSLVPQTCDINAIPTTIIAVTNVDKFSSWIYEIIGYPYETTTPETTTPETTTTRKTTTPETTTTRETTTTEGTTIEEIPTDETTEEIATDETTTEEPTTEEEEP